MALSSKPLYFITILLLFFTISQVRIQWSRINCCIYFFCIFYLRN